MIRIQVVTQNLSTSLLPTADDIVLICPLIMRVICRPPGICIPFPLNPVLTRTATYASLNLSTSAKSTALPALASQYSSSVSKTTLLRASRSMRRRLGSPWPFINASIPATTVAMAPSEATAI
ncbi:hypothetical protein KCU87_g333, partial [Aureobasidium melanogenum]